LKKFNFVLTGALAAALIFPGAALANTVKVERGDTLSKIAVENKTTVNKIKSLNNLRSSVIYPGQILKTAGTYVTKKSVAANKSGVVSNANYLNVRSGPSASYKSLGSLKRGTKVTIHSTKNGWYNITAGNKKGYVSSKYISTSTPAKVAVPTKKKVAVSSAKVFNRPTDGVISSHFGDRAGQPHTGIDYAKSGNVQIKSAAAGIVSKSFFHPSYGEVVFIKHTINGVRYETVYAHLRSGTRAVKVGQKVNTGQMLGWMGSTGHSTGQHLHFEIHKGDWLPGRPNAVNPLTYLK
jgi:murein DD-endopeptidase MepM/ murein hydrolase activator NlpD